MNIFQTDSFNPNEYHGNGWSKYQIMVLQQLEDHNRVLQNLNKEIVDIKQQMAVAETELEAWRKNADTKLDLLEEKMTHVLYDDTGLTRKVSDIQKHFDVEEKASAKVKAVWALYGAVAVFVVNLVVKIAEVWIKTQ